MTAKTKCIKPKFFLRYFWLSNIVESVLQKFLVFDFFFTDHSCPAEYGSVKYVKVGCFEDRKQARALERLLFQDRDKRYKSTYSGQTIKWKQWKTYLPE